MTTYLERLRARELENVGIRMPDALEESDLDDSTEPENISDEFDIEPYHNED